MSSKHQTPRFFALSVFSLILGAACLTTSSAFAAQAATTPSNTSGSSQPTTKPANPSKSTTTTKPATPAKKQPIVQMGSTGDAVKDLQKRLTTAGTYKGKIDGIFGPATEAAVVKFQTSKKLKADGIVGPKTWSALPI